MAKGINPSDIMTPYNNAYYHGVEVPAGGRTLHVSGQVGMAKDGTVPDGMEAQAEVVWQNLTAILRDAGMEVSNIVKMTAYVVGIENFADYAKVRTKYLDGHVCASTGLGVSALIMPELKIEVEIVAVG
jgi:enamine deaminase RidA (YjgF/YER057c/UK114 family)